MYLKLKPDAGDSIDACEVLACKLAIMLGVNVQFQHNDQKVVCSAAGGSFRTSIYSYIEMFTVEQWKDADLDSMPESKIRHHFKGNRNAKISACETCGRRLEASVHV